MVVLIFFHVILLFCSEAHSSLSYSSVNISDGGYIGVMIAIHPGVQQNESLINAIKETWTNASHELYIATGNRAYFKQITILLPNTWKSDEYEDVKGNQNYDRADIVIAESDDLYGNEPYTVQYDGCGKMGIRSHYTTTYLMDDKYIENYGPRGRVVVHEWAHYRWGIFDETSDDEPFYWDDSVGLYEEGIGPTATRCSRDLSGHIVNINSEYRNCTLLDLDNITNSYPDYCKFFPNQIQDSNSSLMSYQCLDNIVGFCKDAEDNSTKISNIHNVKAPNSQNRLCGMRSTWSVIKNSSDYSKWNIMDMADTTPTFDVVVSRVNRRFVMVMDDSGSMGSSCGSVTRSDCMKKAAYHFITTAIPGNSYLGNVAFGSNSMVLNNLTAMNGDGSRDQLIQSISPLNAGSGSTCIGCGIKSAISVLETNGISSAAGGRVIVITDGEEGVAPYVREVRSEVLRKGIIIEAVFIVTDANDDLKVLAEDSGGKHFFATSQLELLGILNQISNSESLGENTYQIYSKSFELNNGDPNLSSVRIDSTIGLSTVFSFTWSTGVDAPHIKILSPTGCFYSNYISQKLCTTGGSSHVDSTLFYTIQFRIPETSKVGLWKCDVRPLDLSAAVGPMTLIVTSATRNASVSPIFTESGMGETRIDDGPGRVFAKVAKGTNPILGATVVATMRGPRDTLKSVELYDNGAGSDIHANDGIYSRYFTEFTGRGRYSVQVDVSSGANTRETARKLGSGAQYCSGFITEQGLVHVNPNGAVASEGSSYVEVGEFSRVDVAGSFDYYGAVDVHNVSAIDVVPPAAISDAKLRQIDLADYTKGIELEFTAPGDDYDIGKASGYDVRFTITDPRDLINSFDSNMMLSQRYLVKGNLSNPSPAGFHETFVLLPPGLPPAGGAVLPIKFLPVSVAVKAFDESGNYAEISNIIAITFLLELPRLPISATTSSTTLRTAVSSYIQNTTTILNDDRNTTTTTTTFITKNTTAQQLAVWVIVVIAVGSFAVTAAAVLGIYISIIRKSPSFDNHIPPNLPPRV